MERKNIVGIDTQFGYRTVELFEGDLVALGRSVDVLVCSAFANQYGALPGTVIGSLKSKLGIDVSSCRENAEFDLTSALGVWISKPLRGYEFSRLLCAEILGAGLAIPDVIENVFVGLSILEAKGGAVSSIALPVLGAGALAVDPAIIIDTLLHRVETFFRRSSAGRTVLLVEKDVGRAALLDQALDRTLGRVRVCVPVSELLDSLRGDISNKLFEAGDLFDHAPSNLRDEWMTLLASESIRSFEVGVLSRRLLELLVRKLGAQGSGPLQKRIDGLEATHVAPWIRGYMHVLRHVGNESAHEGRKEGRLPPSVESIDLSLCLACVNRLLEFWIRHRQSIPPTR